MNGEHNETTNSERTIAPKIASYQGKGPLARFVYMCARNFMFDSMKQQSKRKQVPLNPAAATIAYVDPTLRAEQKQALATAVKSLPTKQRLAVQLKIERRKGKDIAAILEVDPGHVSRLLQAAYEHIRLEMGPLGEDLPADANLLVELLDELLDDTET